MPKTAQIILNLIVGLVSLVFFIILLFPLDSMISHFLADIERQTKGRENIRISVSNIDASLVFDTEFENLRIFQKDKEIFYAPKVSAGISLLPLISETISVRFAAEYRKGLVEGKVSLADDSVIDVELEKVSLRELKFLTRFLDEKGWPKLTSGELSGTVYYTWSRDLRNKEGEVNLKLGKAKTSMIPIKAAAMEVPPLILSEKGKFIEIEGALDKGRISINKFKIPGPDVVLNLNGSANLNRSNALIRSKIDGSFGFSEKVKEKVPFIAMLEGQQNGDGTFPISIKGSAKKPDIKIGEIEVSKMLGL